MSYASTGEMPKESRSKLLAEVDQASRQHSWWAESICLWETDNGVCGDTKIFLLGYSNNEGQYREVSPEDDSIMAWRDGTRILGLLQDYSKRYGVAWEVEVAGDSFGSIAGTDADMAAFAAANEWLRLAGIEANDPSLPSRIESIDHAFADRWDT